MRKYALLAALLSVPALSAASPAYAVACCNSLLHNALVHNGPAPTGSAAAGPQLQDLNGVALEAVTLPAPRAAEVPLLAFNPQPDPPGLQEDDWEARM